jgi:hypothetical protein
MGQLSDAIAEAKIREIQRNESKLAEQLALPPPADLDDETKRSLVPFIEWATTANVRYCPALPTTIGAFVLAQAAARIPEQQILDQVAAIAQLHDHYGLPSPIATTAARYALEQVVKSEAPRSWTREEKLLWASLPPEIRAVIQRRDKDQEKAMRRAKPADNTTNEMDVQEHAQEKERLE